MYIAAKNLKRRSGSESIPVFETQDQHQVVSGSDTIYNSDENKKSELIRQFAGYDNPDYHSMLKEGKLIPHTPFYNVKISGDTYGSYDITYKSGYRYYSTSFTPYDSWCIGEDELWAYAPTDPEKWVTEAAAKVYSSGYDALTALAELKDVMKTFKQAAYTLSHLPSELKKIKGGFSAIKRLSSENLSARYGWRTLVFDIVSLAKTINSLNQTFDRHSERCGHTDEFTYDDAWDTEYSSYTIGHSVHDIVEVSVRGSITADKEVPQFQFNPLQTGWELIPLSFVLDWFINVGKTLAAISFLTISGNYAASWGWQVRVDRRYSADIVEYADNFQTGYRSQVGQSTGILRKRRPCRVQYIPSFNVRLNGWKVVDLISLVIQRWK
jgi:hypothetical protein